MTNTLGFGEDYTVRGLAPGKAELSLSVVTGNVRLANSTVSVDVQSASLYVPSVPASVAVGKGLQTAIPFRRYPPDSFTVTVDDPSLVVLRFS